ncbi:MAG: polysaccharide deacetylase family protein [Verrucomicrobia bacterium]|nr:polysaccharide deacetylase family protein [Verrucomicrobiota bacterium]
MRFRPTVTIWFIVLAPFLTFLMVAAGSFWGLLVLFASHLLLVAVTLVPSLQGFGPVLTRYSTSAKTAWLTIDDGPDPGTTPQIIALLQKYGARATFFLIGAKAAKHPELACMILDAGHAIGNHTQNHPGFSFWRFGPRALAREIDQFEATIFRIGLAAPIWFRAPAGLKNPFLHPILAARGLQLVGWSARAFDTQILDSSRIVERIKRSIAPGSIILFHEGHRPAVCLEALDQLLRELSAEQFRLVLPPLRELLPTGHSAPWKTSLNAIRSGRQFARMDQYYVVLAEALQERLAVIADHPLRGQNPDAHLLRLKQASERIEQLRNRLPPDADPMLVHYLGRMSFSKALEFVRERYLS